ncbi:hypothetical protein ACFYTG_16560 [Streptomyces mirabilis]|uniref:hypothetical protein n=1 Tax=Streptomyces mirabilis TaxID=68239 RepID=UPI00368AA768
MRRIILPIAAILLTAACGSGNTVHAAPASKAAPARTPVKSHSSAATPTHSAPRAAKPKPSPSTSPKECPSVGDVILWMKVPGVPDSAQVLGGNGYPNCESTFQTVQRTSPNVPGACTEAAWASDNPGYNVDATPAKRLKKVQVAVGPAC